MSFSLPGTIAKVYLLNQGDEKNVCYINNKQLLVIRKNRPTYISLDLILQISFSTKKFLLPLIIGGILTPFFLLALLNTMFHPYVTLVGFLIGVYLFYLGYSGSPSMIISGHNTIKEIFLPFISPNLRAFAKFVNEEVLLKKEDEQLYHYAIYADENQIEQLRRGEEYHFKSGIELHPSYSRQGTDVKPKQNLKKVIINIKMLDGKISYFKSDNDSLNLFYKGKISIQDVVSGLEES